MDSELVDQTTKLLCLIRDDVFPQGLPIGKQEFYISAVSSLLTVKSVTVDRSICEFNDKFLQLIPYVTLFDKTTNDFFIYYKDGNPVLYSIGIGGHIVESLEELNIATSISLEVANILQEQVGIDYNESTVNLLEQKILQDNCCGIYYTGTDISRRHLFISMFLGINKSDIKHVTALTRKYGQWLSAKEIINRIDQKLITLDVWSNMVMKVIEDVYDN